MALTNALLTAKVMHARQRPKKHVFTYGVFYLCFALGDLAKLPSKILSLNKWNLFAFYDKDHGRRNGSPLSDWIKSILADYGLAEADGEIVLTALPRVAGYVFNPVSFWFCFDRNKQLRAVLSEVCNTFGERHCYISFHDDHRAIMPDDWLRADKIFHVSPFLQVTGHYLFRFACDDERVRVLINYHDADGLMLATSIAGKRMPLNAANLIKCFFRYPLVSFKVIALIHGEALRLIFKGARYRRKPLPPTTQVTR